LLGEVSAVFKFYAFEGEFFGEVFIGGVFGVVYSMIMVN
jgi:hypothetical protein